MRDATGFGTQWAGWSPRSVGAEHAPEGQVGRPDPAHTPTELKAFTEAFKGGGTQKWGLGVDGDGARAAAAAGHGMVLDSRPAPMVATLAELPFVGARPGANSRQRRRRPRHGRVVRARGSPNASSAPAARPSRAPPDDREPRRARLGVTTIGTLHLDEPLLTQTA